MNRHTPEPWTIMGPRNQPDVELQYEQEFVIVGPDIGNGYATVPAICDDEANVERIAACVNACANLNPAAIPGLVEAVRKHVADWDAQVADHRAACFQCPDPDDITALRSALASVTGDGKGGA